MYAIFQSLWVRKLIGQARGLYTPGLRVRGSPHPVQAAASSVSLIHSDCVFPVRSTASRSRFASSRANLTPIKTCLDLVFGTLGLPGFLAIKHLMFYKNKACVKHIFVLHLLQVKNDMANNLKIEKKVAVISMLAEGASILAVERITGIHEDTIGRLALRVGQACKNIMDEKMRGLPCKRIEIDEIWGFIGSKQKNAKRAGTFGDVWTFIALDADSKLIPSFIVGKRDAYHAKMFMDDLASRLAMRVQVSSDALAAYPDAFERSFGAGADYGQIVKTFSVVPLGNASAPASVRYSPAEVVKVEKTAMSGAPNMALITTSHIEKQNHTLRMHCRRLTRLTNAFSKKFENFEAAIALNFAYYNFCKRHITIRMTPAMAAGIENSFWTVSELVERCGE
jgi:IS1 family transposase